jgi:hypothetical protein
VDLIWEYPSCVVTSCFNFQEDLLCLLGALIIGLHPHTSTLHFLWDMGQWELHALTLNYSNIFFTKLRFDIVSGVANTFIGWWGLRRCDQKKLKFMFFIFNFPIHEFYRILLCSYCAFGGLVTTHGNHTPSLLTSHCRLPLFVTSPSCLPCFLWSPWC